MAPITSWWAARSRAPPTPPRRPPASSATSRRRPRPRTSGREPPGRPPHRNFRLALCPLARHLLPRKAGRLEMARLLRAAIRYRRAEQHVLPPAYGERARHLARFLALRLPVCRQGEPIPDPHEKAEGPGARRGEVLRARRPAGPQTGTDCLPVAAVVGAESRAARGLSRSPAAAPPLRLRAAQSHVAHGRRLSPSAPP